MNEEEERQNNKQGSQWAASKLKNRDNNDERSKKPSKWGDKESDDNTKEDQWNKKSAEHTSSIDETNVEEGPHQTSAPMDLDNYEGEGVDNIEQLQKVQEQETINSNMTFKQLDEIENKADQKETQEHHEISVYANSNNEDKNVEQNNEEQLNKNQPFGDYQNDFTNNSQELFHDNIKETQQNSQKTSINNFEQQHLETKLHDDYQSHEEYQNNSKDNLNSQQENEIRQTNEEFVQNVQFKSNYSNMKYENNQPNNHQSFNEESFNNSNNEDCSVNAIVSQVDNAKKDVNIEEKSCAPRDDFYFGGDSESSNNIEQQNNEILPIEEPVNVPTDNEMNDISTAELNQS